MIVPTFREVLGRGYDPAAGSRILALLAAKKEQQREAQACKR